MQSWLKLLIIVIFFLALGFFGTKFIKDKLDTTIEDQDKEISGSNETNNSGSDSEERPKSDSYFGDFGELFGG